MEILFHNIANRLTNFFTRSVAPSSVFFVLLFFVDYFFNNEKIFDEVFIYFDEISHLNKILLYVVLVLIFLSYGYINQVFSQILDNTIKENYEFSDLASEYNYIKEYQKLRNKVKAKAIKEYRDIFESIQFNDYNAYLVLGKEFNFKGKLHVDEVKTIHTLYIAFSINLVILLSFFDSFIILSLPLISLLYFVENFIARGRFLARNKKLYINFLVSKSTIKKKNIELNM